MVEGNTEVEQELLCFKRGISSGAREIDGVVQKVPALFVQQVDIGTVCFHKLRDLCIISADHGVL